MIGAPDAKEKANIMYHGLINSVKDIVERGATPIRTLRDQMCMIGDLVATAQGMPGNREVKSCHRVKATSYKSFTAISPNYKYLVACHI